MGIRDQVSVLVLKAKNLLSPGTDAAADSVDNLGDSADALRDKLRSLEDQGRLVKQFTQAEKAVARTGKAWDSAKLKVTRLQEQIEKSGTATKTQAAALELASKSAAKAEAEYRKSEKVLEELGDEAAQAGVDLKDLNKAQQQNQKETVKARRALHDFNEETEQGSGKLLTFRKNLSRGIGTLAKWGAAAAAAGTAAAVATITRFTASQASLAKQALASASALGVSVDALQKWRYAAEEVGIGGDKVVDIFKDISDKVGDALLNGVGPAADVIKGLGLNLKELAALRPDEQILAISERLEGLPKPAQIQILESLASDAALLLPLLGDNAAKLRELGSAAEARGAIFTEDELKKLAQVDRAFKDIVLRISGFAKGIAVQLAPAFTKMARAIDGALKDKPELVDKISKAFNTLLTKTSEWVETFTTKGREIKDSWKPLSYTIDGLRLTFLGLFRGIQSLGAGALEVAARVAYSWKGAGLAILEVRNKIGLASDEAVEVARQSLGVIGQSVLDLKKQSEDYQDQMIAAGNDAATAFAKAKEGAISAGKALVGMITDSEKLSDVVGGMPKLYGDVVGNAEKLQKTQQQLGVEIAATALAIEAANVAWSNDPSDENLAHLEELRVKYNELQDALTDLSKNVPGPVDTGLVDQYRKAADAIEETGAAAEDASGKVSKISDEASDVGKEVETVGRAATESAGSFGSAIAGIVGGWASRIAALSENASAQFRRSLGFKDAAGEAGTLDDRLASINDKLARLRERVSASGIVRAIKSWAKAGLETERTFLQQQITVEKLTRRIIEGGSAMNVLRLSAEDVERRFNLLDQQQLSGLVGAIHSAQREVAGLKDSLDDTLSAARQELASLEGDSAKVERLRYLERQNELQEQLNRARAFGDKEAIAKATEALELAERAHKLRLEQAQEATEADKKRQLELEQDRASRAQADEVEERQDISRTERRTQTQTTQISRAVSQQVVTLNLQANGQSIGRLSNLDPDEVALLLQSIEQSGYLTTG